MDRLLQLVLITSKCLNTYLINFILQLNGAAQQIAPGLIGVDYDDLTDEMKSPSCWSEVMYIYGYIGT